MEILPCSDDLAGLPPMAVQQHPNYLRTIQRMGHSARAHAICDAGQAIARVQVVRRRFGPVPVNWIARGPVWAGDIDIMAKASALRALTRHLGGAALTLAAPDRHDDLAACRAVRFRAIMTPQSIAELDVTRPEGTRLAAQHGKWRNRLRHGQSQQITVTDSPFRPDRDMHLLALEATQRQHRGYRALPLPFVQQWAQAHPKGIRLFRAAGKSGLCAFMLILLHPPGATYHIGWSDANGRLSSSHNLLMWQASNWLAQRGYTRFDLGVVDTDHSPGLARFKIGTGAEVRALGPTLVQFGRPRLFSHTARAA